MCRKVRGVRRIAVRVARLQRAAVGAREEGAHVRLLRLREIAIDEARHALRHGNAVLRSPDRRRKQFLPWQRAVARMCAAQHRDRARHAGRAAGEHGIPIRKRRAILAEEHAGRRSLRCGLAAVEGGDLVRRRVVEEEKCTAADAGALRLYEAEHGLDGDGGIDCRASCREDLEAGIDRVRVGRGDSGAARGGGGHWDRKGRCRRRDGLDRRGTGGHHGRRKQENQSHGWHSATFARDCQPRRQPGCARGHSSPLFRLPAVTAGVN